MRTVLVTGASGAIGRATALAFLQEGDRVGLGCFRRAGETQAFCAQARAKGLNAQCLPFDARDPAACRAAVQALGRVDVLVHNAGLPHIALLQDTTDQAWRQLFALHVDAAFYLTKACLPHMLDRQAGCIVLVGSMWGQVGASMETAYSAAKAALIGYAKALAKELGPSGIRVNCVCPGLIDTPMNAALAPEALADICEETPLGRMGTPEEVAQAIRFLASPQAGFITGQVLGVNGGLVV